MFFFFCWMNEFPIILQSLYIYKGSIASLSRSQTQTQETQPEERATGRGYQCVQCSPGGQRRYIQWRGVTKRRRGQRCFARIDERQLQRQTIKWWQRWLRTSQENKALPLLPTLCWSHAGGRQQNGGASWQQPPTLHSHINVHSKLYFCSLVDGGSGLGDGRVFMYLHNYGQKVHVVHKVYAPVLLSCKSVSWPLEEGPGRGKGQPRAGVNTSFKQLEGREGSSK